MTTYWTSVFLRSSCFYLQSEERFLSLELFSCKTQSLMEQVDEDPSNPKDQWIDKQGTKNKNYFLSTTCIVYGFLRNETPAYVPARNHGPRRIISFDANFIYDI